MLFGNLALLKAIGLKIDYWKWIPGRLSSTSNLPPKVNKCPNNPFILPMSKMHKWNPIFSQRLIILLTFRIPFVISHKYTCRIGFYSGMLLLLPVRLLTVLVHFFIQFQRCQFQSSSHRNGLHVSKWARQKYIPRIFHRFRLYFALNIQMEAANKKKNEFEWPSKKKKREEIII